MAACFRDDFNGPLNELWFIPVSLENFQRHIFCIAADDLNCLGYVGQARGERAWDH